MPVEQLALLWKNIQSAEPSSVRITESVPIMSKDVLLVKNSFFILGAILLEEANGALERSRFLSLGGNICKILPSLLIHPGGISYTLRALDEVNDILIRGLSVHGIGFKAHTLRKQIHTTFLETCPELWKLTSPLISAYLESRLEAKGVRFLRLIFSILSKLEIDRSDLLSDHYSSYLEDEELFRIEQLVQRAKCRDYGHLVKGLRREINPIIDNFSMEDFIPRHGPGAVSIPGVFGKDQKYSNLCRDHRIAFLLREKYDYEAYAPRGFTQEDRTSRVIFVPKTWKKLRGISAEPAGLQYFQQAVFAQIERSICDSGYRRFVNLRDQQYSRHLAQLGSIDGRLATIDLSSASDSITVQLVRDIFGSSLLAQWLFATRSTSTILNGQSIRINKFAPMGSACCFPLECIVFLGITLNVARRCGFDPWKIPVRIFGDDIILPSTLAEPLINDLTILGFDVNSSKSFWKGNFRESCGVDAWCGVDITPLKIKRLSLDFSGSISTYRDHSRCVSLLNELLFRGYPASRSFLLEKFLKVRVPRTRNSLSDFTQFGDGSRGSVFSTHSSNFNLPVRMKYGRVHFKKLDWKVEAPSVSDDIGYFEWLINHSGVLTPQRYTLEWFRSQDSIPCNLDAQKPHVVRVISTLVDSEVPILR